MLTSTLFPFLSLGDKPKLKQLQKLDCPSGSKLRVINTIAAKWIRLAIALDIDYSAEQGDTRDDDEAIISILRRWIDGEGEQPVTWGTLIEALEDAGCENLANDLRRELGSQADQ